MEERFYLKKPDGTDFVWQREYKFSFDPVEIPLTDDEMREAWAVAKKTRPPLGEGRYSETIRFYVENHLFMSMYHDWYHEMEERWGYESNR